ncbi:MULTISPECIES: universal stress protein [Halopseudomonas]|nr:MULTISPECIES: universal stress protein [Halopseudomonas]WGK62891.1 universal stress protein [Halopseudomonas sp. SMJS2]SES13306.1 Nucleotide-binding universal stress protein, UspA family [Halopseudomonas bauzanensis]SFM12098.1 Nucleotide-binding universal stress protein, UspA family [Halopseudomonas bauzanensis]
MYKVILVPVDIDHKASWAKSLPTAIQLCQTYGASLHLVSIIPSVRMPMVDGFFPEDFTATAKKKMKEALQAFAAKQVPAELKAKLIVVDGKAYEGILRVAKKINADLIVMSTHKRKRIEDYLIGTNAMRVLQQSKVSVLVVR